MLPLFLNIPSSHACCSGKLITYFEEQYLNGIPKLTPSPSDLLSSSINGQKGNKAIIKSAQVEALALIEVADWKQLANLSQVLQVASLALEYKKARTTLETKIKDGEAECHLS